jgi:hypothetical protein
LKYAYKNTNDDEGNKGIEFKLCYQNKQQQYSKNDNQ